MTPDTVHFLAQLIRHQRGILTAFEKWAKTPSFGRDDVLDVVYTYRRLIDSYEAQLSKVVTDDSVV
jgi:hypothetical protein